MDPHPHDPHNRHHVTSASGPSPLGSSSDHLLMMLGHLQGSFQMLVASTDEHRASTAEGHRHIVDQLNLMADRIHQRIDTVESRVGAVETAQAASTASRRPDQPWWRDMGPKEALSWVVVALGIIALLRRPELAEQLVSKVLN